MICRTTDWLSSRYAPLTVRTNVLATTSSICGTYALAPRVRTANRVQPSGSDNRATSQVREPEPQQPDHTPPTTTPVTKRATVLFTRGSNELTVAAKNTLDALIGVLRNAEVKQLTVTGYASAEWSSQPANALTNNDALARRRAMIVSDYLRSSISGLDVQQRSAVNLSDAAEQSRSAVISYQI